MNTNTKKNKNYSENTKNTNTFEKVAKVDNFSSIHILTKFN